MATFAFSGRTRAGETISGERAGDTMDAVVAALRREQIQVTRITPGGGQGRRGGPGEEAARQERARRRTSPSSSGSSR